jgi:CRISPR-associated protein Csd1
MILQSLVALAEREGLVATPDYEVKEVHWRISVTRDGKFVGIESLLEAPAAQGKPGRPRGPGEEVPRPLPGARSTGVTPDAGFLVGNVSFVLGLDFSDDRKYAGRSGELERRTGQFRQLVKEAAEATGDTGLVAVAAFLSSKSQADRARREVTARVVDKVLQPNHLLTFRLADDKVPYVHERPFVKKYWAKLRGGRAAKESASQCLVTGITAPIADKHPLIKLPGGTPSGVAIVSFNCAAFESYGFERNDNAPVSRRAAEAYTAALTRLLAPAFPDPRNRKVALPQQRINLSANTVAVFWTDQPSAVATAIAPAVGDGNLEAARALGASLEVDESYANVEASVRPSSVEPVRGTYQAPWKGITPRDLEDPGAFRVLVLSGGQGRATVRAFHSSRIRETVEAVRGWFRDIAVQGLTGAPALYRLLSTLAERGQKENLPPDLAGEVFLAALSGRALPVGVLEAAVRRSRREPRDRRHGKVPAERAALVKAYLNRARAQLVAAHSIEFEEVKSAMNENERNRGYLLGRMFACIERMQELALGDVGASVTDRYFGAACATPQTVFPRLLKTEVHHYRKAADGNRGGAARWLHGQISALASWLVGKENGMADGEAVEAFLRRTAGRPLVGFPAFLPLPEQGLFTLGYHQQRAEFFRRRPDTAESSESTSTVTPDGGQA